MEHNKSITEKERNELNEKYANVKLQKLAPRSEWVTVEEMRTILKMKILIFIQRNDNICKNI